MQRPVTERVSELPPSAKLVFLVLKESDEPLDRDRLVEETMLPARTARYALKRLGEVGAVERRNPESDGRVADYRLRESEQ